MLATNTIKPNEGSRKTSKRLGRGNGSGKWSYSGRGCKGQNSRAGGGTPDWFEGGQTPLFRRMPKLKGFSNKIFKKEYNILNLSDLQKIADSGLTHVNLETLNEKKLLKRKAFALKILANGELKSQLTIVADRASKTAIEAIEKAGGSIQLTEKTQA